MDPDNSLLPFTKFPLPLSGILFRLHLLNNIPRFLFNFFKIIDIAPFRLYNTIYIVRSPPFPDESLSIQEEL